MNIGWLKAFGNSSYGRFAATATEGINKHIVDTNLFKIFEDFVGGNIGSRTFLSETWTHQKTFFVLCCAILVLNFLYLVIITPFLMKFIYSGSRPRPKRYWKKPVTPLAIPALASSFIVILGLATCFGATGLMDFFISELPKDRRNFENAVTAFENRHVSTALKEYTDRAQTLLAHVSSSGIDDKGHFNKSINFIGNNTFFKDIVRVVSSKGLNFGDNMDINYVQNINRYRSWSLFVFLVIYLVMIVLFSIGAFSGRSIFSLSATFLIIMTFLLCLYAQANYFGASIISSACSESMGTFASSVLKNQDLRFDWEKFFTVCSNNKNNILDALDTIYRKEHEVVVLGSMTFFNASIGHSKHIIRLTKKNPDNFYVEYNITSKEFRVYPLLDDGILINIRSSANSTTKKILDEYHKGLSSTMMHRSLDCSDLGNLFHQVHNQVCHNGKNSFNSLNSGLYAVVIFATIALILAPVIVRRLRKRKLIYNPKEDLE